MTVGLAAADAAPASPAVTVVPPPPPALPTAEPQHVSSANDAEPNRDEQKAGTEEAASAVSEPEAAASRQRAGTQPTALPSVADPAESAVVVPSPRLPGPGQTAPALNLLGAPDDALPLLGVDSAAPAQEEQASPQQPAAALKAGEGPAPELGDLLGSLDGSPAGGTLAAAPAASSGGLWEEEQLSDDESMESGSAEVTGHAAPAALDIAGAAASGPQTVGMSADGPQTTRQPSLAGLSDVSTETEGGTGDEGGAPEAAAGLLSPAGELQPLAIQQPEPPSLPGASQGLHGEALHPGTVSATAVAARPASDRGGSPRPQEQQQRQEVALPLDLLPPVEQPAAAAEQRGAEGGDVPPGDAQAGQQGQQESLLQAAERLEARLAAGGGSSEGPGGGWAVQPATGQYEEAAYQSDLLMASIISQVGGLRWCGLRGERSSGDWRPAGRGAEREAQSHFCSAFCHVLRRLECRLFAAAALHAAYQGTRLQPWWPFCAAGA